MQVGTRVREFFRWFYRYRSIRLTPEGTRFVVLALAIGVAAINTGNNLLYLLLAMMLSLIVVSGILSEQSLRDLEIRRLWPRELFANRPATASLYLRNGKPRLPTFSLHLQDVVAGATVDRGIHLLHLAPQASTLQHFPLLVPRRGLYRIEAIKLQTRFPFGLFLKTATRPDEEELIVFPELAPLPERMTRELAALGHEQSAARKGQGTDLHNLRAYRPGDDSRTIHWRTTARLAQVTVKETEAEDQQKVMLIVPTVCPQPSSRERDAAFEEALSLAASLIEHFDGAGYAVGLTVGTLAIPPDAGQGQRDALFRALALCTPDYLGAATDEQARRDRSASLPVPSSGALTVLVLAWPDPLVEAALPGVDCTIRAWESA